MALAASLPSAPRSLACVVVVGISLLLPQAAESRRPPSDEELVRQAAQPYASGWLSQGSLALLAMPEVPCTNVFQSVDWIVWQLQGDVIKHRSLLHQWQDYLISNAYNGQDAHNFFRSNEYRSLFRPVLTTYRLAQNAMEFLVVMAQMHGERCFFSALRDALGNAVVALKSFSLQVHSMQFAVIYNSYYSFWESSSDVLRHIAPMITAIEEASKLGGALNDARLVLDKLVQPGGGIKEPEPTAFEWHDEGGAFSAMHFLQRQMSGGWHLDYSLAISLVRLWTPAEERLGTDPCHATIVDFGAGGGHYCDFMNRTGEYCCNAYDGAPRAAEYSEGKVLTQRLDVEFDLGRQWDWVVCLEVAEHVPRAAEGILLGNLRRHAKKGLVLSWSQHDGGPHQNARPWEEVRQLVEGAGFELDEKASAQLRPKVSWLIGAVHLFRVK
eukprot:TRINITY_DN73363_c0_g1_i1.p1 TRINITY_DN73363_c0_g1~~TRINITY_DN73363_c0_g1_i1.p1  ORF type:complete len:440 (+),score=112.43 TRINITY_DN73363_c0_g1_i1:144-1463(+)